MQTYATVPGRRAAVPVNAPKPKGLVNSNLPKTNKASKAKRKGK